MPTTTATITLSSADIDASPLSVSTTMTLSKAALTTGVDQITGMNRRIIRADDITKVMLISTIIGGVYTTKGVTLASDDATVTHVADSTVTTRAGQPVIGTNIATDATVSTFTDTTHFELSAVAADAVASAKGSLTIGYSKYTANKANKVYICNSSTDDTDYIVITIKNEEIGRLYAGDWMFFPWSAPDIASSIFVTAATQTNTTIVDWMVIGEGDS
jgi:hypothetical protein